jgi:glycerophosphoryl diester phosphodiesterase
MDNHSCFVLRLSLPFAVLSRISSPIMTPILALVAGLAAFGAVNAMPFTIPYLDKTGRVEVQGHRGGLSMRTEESLWAFAHALVYDYICLE